MATLYLARRRGAAGFSRPVAIKVVHPHLSDDQRFVSMFVDEALLCSRIDHPNVVRVDELAEKDGHYYLVMEYVQGCSLATFTRIVRDSGRRVAPELAVAIAMRIAAGLDVVHELKLDDGRPAQVVHRDVTPSNVLIGFRGEVKLIDFGIAKAADRAQATRTGTLKGKVAYMSPEQAFGRDVDRRTDIYALGILLWEMICMRRLFVGASDLAILESVRRPTITPPSYYAPDIPEDLDGVIMGALAADPSQRPMTAREFREKLVAALPQALMLDAPQIAGVVRGVLAEGTDADRMSIPTEVEPLSGEEDAVVSSIVSQLILPQTEPGHGPTRGREDHDFQLHAAQTLLQAEPYIPAPAAGTPAGPPSRRPSNVPLLLGLAAAMAGLLAFGVVGALSLTRADDPVDPPFEVTAPEDRPAVEDPFAASPPSRVDALDDPIGAAAEGDGNDESAPEAEPEAEAETEDPEPTPMRRRPTMRRGDSTMTTSTGTSTPMMRTTMLIVEDLDF